MTPRKRINAEDTEDTLLYRFARDVLCERRYKLGLEQQDIANRVGFTQPTISRLEKGHRLKSREEVNTFAKGYGLTAAEKARWLELLFGIPQFTIEYMEEVVLRTQSVLKVTTNPGSYDYFATLYGYQRFAYVDPYWDELHGVLSHLIEHGESPAKKQLLVELGAVLLHYLDGRGHFQERLSLASTAAKTAASLERYTIAGWLYCDGIPWTYMDSFPDYILHAQASIKKGLVIAAKIGNSDIMALGLAFLARTYITESYLNMAKADAIIQEALEVKSSDIIKTRVYTVKAKIDSAKHQPNTVMGWYEKARDAAKGTASRAYPVPARLGIIETYIELDDYASARQELELLFTDMQQTPHSPHRQAEAHYLFALVSQQEGNQVSAKSHAQMAYSILDKLDLLPQFRRKISQLLTRIQPSSSLMQP